MKSKHLFPSITLILLLLIAFPLSAQKVKLDSPIYLGALLVDKLDTADMAETCRYYKLTEAPSEDGFIVFTAADGTKIRFKMTDKTPIIEVITKESPSSIKKRLLQSGFKKSDNDYIKGSIQLKRTTICNYSSNTLRFAKISSL